MHACPVLSLCDPMDCSPPGSSLDGISQARILEWLAISFSRRSFRPRNQTRSPVSWADPKLSHQFLIIVGCSDTYWLTGIFRNLQFDPLSSIFHSFFPVNADMMFPFKDSSTFEEERIYTKDRNTQESCN